MPEVLPVRRHPLTIWGMSVDPGVVTRPCGSVIVTRAAPATGVAAILQRPPLQRLEGSRTSECALRAYALGGVRRRLGGVGSSQNPEARAPLLAPPLPSGREANNESKAQQTNRCRPPAAHRGAGACTTRVCNRGVISVPPERATGGNRQATHHMGPAQVKEEQPAASITAGFFHARNRPTVGNGPGIFSPDMATRLVKQSQRTNAMLRRRRPMHML